MFKNLFKNLAQSIALSVLLMVCFGLIGWVWGVVASQPVEVAKGSYLVINLDAQIVEAPQQLEEGLFAKEDAYTLRQLLKTIQYAKGEPTLSGIILHGGLKKSDKLSWAAVEELRGALEDFKANKKSILAFSTNYDERGYYLASVANTITLHPQAEFVFNGIGGQMPYFKGLLNNLGITVEVVRAGKYKSYGEPFTRSSMSPEDREQTSALISGLWSTVRGTLSAARNIPDATLEQIADTQGLLTAQEAQSAKLVDAIDYWEGFLQSNKINKEEQLLEVDDYIKNVAQSLQKAKTTLAIVYFDGALMDDEQYSECVDTLRKLKEDKSVKGVLFRVNSPGGAVLPSDTIAWELKQIATQKPVVVSMGGVAASGGYWISCVGTQVLTDKLTITGSIGVVGLFPSAEVAAQKIGLSFDSVLTGPLADLGTITRPMSPAAREVVQRSVAEAYTRFVHHVALSRRMTDAQVHELAQGRVWLGQEAIAIKFADRVGGILAAEDTLKELTHLTQAKFVTYPQADKLRFIKKLMGESEPSILGIKLRPTLHTLLHGDKLWAIAPLGFGGSIN